MLFRSNPVVSTVEDGTSLMLSALAVFAPLVAALLLAVIVVGVYRFWSARRVRRLT